MAKPSARQVHVADRNFACTNCGRCCRGWHVHVTAEEKARLAALSWEPADRIPGQITMKIGGSDYLAHRDNGACIYLDEAANRCLIHQRHGYDAKPLGCKVYPYAIAPTFPGEFSVTGRFDCPAIRANEGPPIRRDLDHIRGYIDSMGLGGGFEHHDLDELEPDTARRIVDALCTRVLADTRLDPASRLVVALLAVDRLELMGPIFLNETDLAMIFPSFFDRVRSDLSHQKIRRLSIFERWRFLSLISGYLRRDEEIVGKGFGPRLARMLAMLRLYVGRANLHALGSDYPDLPLDRRRLFAEPVANGSDIDWAPYLELVEVRLKAWQFMGPANFGLGFFVGLKSLLLTFPLVLAVAKIGALAREASGCRLTPEDIDFAVGAIDHSFGRSNFLKLGMFTTITRQVTEPPAYIRLLYGLYGKPEASVRGAEVVNRNGGE